IKKPKKSTELLRQKQHLKSEKILVVYVAADEQHIDPEHPQYIDILLTFTPHLLQDLKDAAQPSSVILRHI
ncbi:MAG: hypothetical protein O4749_11520, partial [Trichodesmium sp. St5_bin2_1]|nr:hypothetical protein [Trichodesmium sp. St5_bin2_1]